MYEWSEGDTRQGSRCKKETTGLQSKRVVGVKRGGQKNGGTQITHGKVCSS